MSLEALRTRIPAYAADALLTLDQLLATTLISKKQIWGGLLAASMAARHPLLTREIESEAKLHLSEEEIRHAKIAAMSMAMTNVYWRFWYLNDDKDYIPPDSGLSLKAKNGITVDKIDFEFWELCPSVIGHCVGCVKTHTRGLLKQGFTKEQVLFAPRIAAVVNSLSVVMTAENIN